MKKYTIENLDCPMCAAKIEAGVKNLSCVKDAKVVFATKTLLIDTDDINKVQSEIDSIEEGVIIRENQPKNNEEEEFNVKKELITLGVLLALFGVGFYMTHIFTTPPLLYVSYAVLIAVYVAAGKNVIILSIKNILHGKIFDNDDDG